MHNGSVSKWRNFGKYFNFLHCRLEVPRHNSNIASSLRNIALIEFLCHWNASIWTGYLGFRYFHSPEGVGYLTMWIPDNIGGGGSQKSSAGYWKIRVFHKLWPSLTQKKWCSYSLTIRAGNIDYPFWLTTLDIRFG